MRHWVSGRTGRSFDMKMKTKGLWIIVTLLAAGCTTQVPGWTEKPIGLGRYAVVPPQGITQITGTNCNPTILIHECGKIQVQVKSWQGNRQGSIWINWLTGTVEDETTTNTVETTAGASVSHGP